MYLKYGTASLPLEEKKQTRDIRSVILVITVESASVIVTSVRVNYVVLARILASLFMFWRLQYTMYSTF